MSNVSGTGQRIGYLASSKHVPTKRGDMYFGIWIDVNGDYFDTAHFADSLKSNAFQGGGCYLLLGTVEVDFHFPIVTVHRMAKLAFIPDPRYSGSGRYQSETHRNIREAASMTHRAPCPQEHRSTTEAQTERLSQKGEIEKGLAALNDYVVFLHSSLKTRSPVSVVPPEGLVENFGALWFWKYFL